MDSEKQLERKLCSEVTDLGGWAIKLLPFQLKGLPDRMVLLPQGRIHFVELKSTGLKPTKLQEIIHDRLRGLGFEVFVIDSLEGLNEFIEKL